MIVIYFFVGLVVVLTFAGVLPALFALLWQLLFNPIGMFVAVVLALSIGYYISEND